MEFDITKIDTAKVQKMHHALQQVVIDNYGVSHAEAYSAVSLLCNDLVTIAMGCGDVTREEAAKVLMEFIRSGCEFEPKKYFFVRAAEKEEIEVPGEDDCSEEQHGKAEEASMGS